MKLLDYSGLQHFVQTLKSNAFKIQAYTCKDLTVNALSAPGTSGGVLVMSAMCPAPTGGGNTTLSA